jgi:hypothetical protein
LSTRPASMCPPLPCATCPPACEPADGQPAPSVRMRSTPIAATTMTNTASKFARLGSSRSSPVAASNLIPGWACTAGSLSRVSPYCTGSAGSASDGKSATTSTKPSLLRLRHHLLATHPQHLKLLGVLKAAERHHQRRHQLAQDSTDRHDDQHQLPAAGLIEMPRPRSGRSARPRRAGRSTGWWRPGCAYTRSTRVRRSGKASAARRRRMGRHSRVARPAETVPAATVDTSHRRL